MDLTKESKQHWQQLKSLLGDEKILGADHLDSQFDCIKSPYDCRDIGRAWVVKLSDANTAKLLKIYKPEDENLASQEIDSATILWNSCRTSPIPIVAQPIGGRRFGDGQLILNAFHFVYGNPIKSQKLKDFLLVINRLSSISNVPSSTAITLQFSSLQNFYYWLSPKGTLPELNVDQHQVLFEKDLDSVSILSFDKKKISSIVCNTFHDYGNIINMNKSLVHGDVTSDNIIKSLHGSVLIDVGFACVTTIFFELGGLVSHLGEVVIEPLLDFIGNFASPPTSISVSSRILLAFGFVRAIRRIAYLERMVNRSGFNFEYYRTHTTKQVALISQLLERYR